MQGLLVPIAAFTGQIGGGPKLAGRVLRLLLTVLLLLVAVVIGSVVVYLVKRVESNRFLAGLNDAAAAALGGGIGAR